MAHSPAERIANAAGFFGALTSDRGIAETAAKAVAGQFTTEELKAAKAELENDLGQR